jgi:hypothetical protein
MTEETQEPKTGRLPKPLTPKPGSEVQYAQTEDLQPVFREEGRSDR